MAAASFLPRRVRAADGTKGATQIFEGLNSDGFCFFIKNDDTTLWRSVNELRIAAGRTGQRLYSPTVICGATEQVKNLPPKRAKFFEFNLQAEIYGRVAAMRRKPHFTPRSVAAIVNRGTGTEIVRAGAAE